MRQGDNVEDSKYKTEEVRKFDPRYYNQLRNCILGVNSRR